MASSRDLEVADVIPFRHIENLVSQLRGRDAAKVVRYVLVLILYLSKSVLQEYYQAALCRWSHPD